LALHVDIPKLAHDCREQIDASECRAQLCRVQFPVWNRHIEFRVVERRPIDEPAIPGPGFIKGDVCSRDTRKLPVNKTAGLESYLLQAKQVFRCDASLFPSFKRCQGYRHQLSLGQSWTALYAQPLSVGRECRGRRN